MDDVALAWPRSPGRYIRSGFARRGVVGSDLIRASRGLLTASLSAAGSDSASSDAPTSLPRYFRLLLGFVGLYFDPQYRFQTRERRLI
jgi:hypothetical protein